VAGCEGAAKVREGPEGMADTLQLNRAAEPARCSVEWIVSQAERRREGLGVNELCAAEPGAAPERPFCLKTAMRLKLSPDFGRRNEKTSNRR
jgi:hypothetical protein